MWTDCSDLGLPLSRTFEPQCEGGRSPKADAKREHDAGRSLALWQRWHPSQRRMAGEHDTASFANTSTLLGLCDGGAALCT